MAKANKLSAALCRDIMRIGPLFQLRFLSVFICSLHSMRIYAGVIVIYFLRSIFAAPLLSGLFFGSFLDGIQKGAGVESKLVASSLVVLAYLISIPVVISGVFMFFRKTWARKMFMMVIGLEVFLHLVVMVLTRSLVPTNWIILDAYLLFFLTRRQIVNLFAKEQAIGQMESMA